MNTFATTEMSEFDDIETRRSLTCLATMAVFLMPSISRANFTTPDAAPYHASSTICPQAACMSQAEIVTHVQQALAEHSIPVYAQYITGDDSVFMRLREDKSRAIDIHPDGTIVVILREAQETHYYELCLDDIERVLWLIQS